MVSSVGSSSSVLTSSTSSSSVLSAGSTTTSATAASVPTTASGAASSTTKKLSDIEQQLADYAAATAKQQKQAAAQSKIQVETFQKQVRKSPYSTNGAATDMGTLIKDTSRLNVYSALKADDKGDVYKFKVQSAGDTQIGTLGDKGLRYQVLTRYGSVIADSKEGQGTSSKNFAAMQKGELKLTAGDYYVKVTNDGFTPTKDSSGKAAKAKNYAVQLSQGVYRKDYDTIAQQPKAGDGVPQQSSAQLELQSMLTASADYQIGASGTSKLTGALFG